MTLSVVIPTLPGREESLERTLASLKETCPEHELILVFEASSVGEGWDIGADQATGDYIHLTSDDITWKPGWSEAAIEVCDRGEFPLPLVLNEDGSVQSCGDVNEELRPDGEAGHLSRFPFMTRAMWDLIRPIPPIHYYSDEWVSARAEDAGFQGRVCHGFTFVHDLGMVGSCWTDTRSWQVRLYEDREIYEQHRKAL